MKLLGIWFRTFLFMALVMGHFCFSQMDKTTAPEDLSMQSKEVSIPFYSGLNGYHSFRIPTLIKTKKALIAFAEGRKNSTSDFGDIDLVYRRSKNNGKSWKPMKILFDLDTMAVQNPVPIYMPTQNKIVLLFNTTSLNEHDVLYKDYGPDQERKAFLTSSFDDGETWKKPRDITHDVKDLTWRWHAFGPVHGIQLKEDKHKGRLVAPVAISIGKGMTYCMALVYSDDDGKQWKIGAIDTNLSDNVNSNETTIVELQDGRIYINTRDQNGGSSEKNRGETYSADGGETFEEPIIESDKFPSPVVQSSLLRWSSKKDGSKNMILFSTPSDQQNRKDLIIMASYDESKSWHPLFKVHNGFSAYSDMVKLNKKTLGVIYETDDYKKISFRRIKMSR